MNKTIVQYDSLNTEDIAKILSNSSLKTSIDIRNPETGKIIFKGLKNKVIVPGSGYLARELFDLDTPEITPSYNDRLGIETPEGTETHELDWRTRATQEHPKVLLFCIGLDGCGTEQSQVYPVDYTKWIAPEYMIPFRYPIQSADLSDALRESYFGRVASGDHYAYYFKRFTSGPTLIRQFSDGTPISSNVYEVTSLPVDCFVEVTLTITKEDLREYFIATSSLDQCRFNTISLCYAYPVQVDGIVHYADIRPLTKLNISNEYMIDVTKGVEIVYHVYF